MPSKRPRWEIYSKEMSRLDDGDALWNPAPFSYFKRIQLGDVGYIRRGCFHLLFSAGRSLEGRELGVDVPRTFERLDVGQTFTIEPQPPGYLSTKSVRETPGRPGASIYPLLEPGSRISFQLTGDQGAALLTKHPIYREDVQLEGTFKEYTKEHYASWVTFARERGHPSDIKPVLVTGVDMTRDFAMVVYSKDDDDLTAEFTISAPGIASPWGMWRTPGVVNTNCGPQPRPPPLDTSGGVETNSDESTQCVFVRYYTMRKRLGIPRVIRAAAGPHRLGPGSPDSDRGSPLKARSNLGSGSGAEPPLPGDEEDDRGSPIRAESEDDGVIHNTAADERNDFDVVADFVFGNSDARSVLIHHKDITQFREPGGSINVSSRIFGNRPPFIVDRNGVATIRRQTGPPPNARSDSPPIITPPLSSTGHLSMKEKGKARDMNTGDLQAVLKHDAQRILDEDDNQLNQKFNNMGLDGISNSAEDQETPASDGAISTSMGGEGFLSQFPSVSGIKYDMSLEYILPLQEMRGLGHRLPSHQEYPPQDVPGNTQVGTADTGGSTSGSVWDAPPIWDHSSHHHRQLADPVEPQDASRVDPTSSAGFVLPAVITRDEGNDGVTAMRYNPTPSLPSTSRRRNRSSSSSDEEPTMDVSHAEHLANIRKETARRRRIEAEQRRRDELNEGYAKLKDALPPSNRKSTKVSILERAASHITYLEHSNRQLQQQIGRAEVEAQKLRALNEEMCLSDPKSSPDHPSDQ